MTEVIECLAALTEEFSESYHWALWQVADTHNTSPNTLMPRLTLYPDSRTAWGDMWTLTIHSCAKQDAILKNLICNVMLQPFATLQHGHMDAATSCHMCSIWVPSSVQYQLTYCWGLRACHRIRHVCIQGHFIASGLCCAWWILSTPTTALRTRRYP
jgi:hypothetical protein